MRTVVEDKVVAVAHLVVLLLDVVEGHRRRLVSPPGIELSVVPTAFEPNITSTSVLRGKPVLALASLARRTNLNALVREVLDSAVCHRRDANCSNPNDPPACLDSSSGKAACHWDSNPANLVHLEDGARMATFVAPLPFCVPIRTSHLVAHSFLFLDQNVTLETISDGLCLEKRRAIGKSVLLLGQKSPDTEVRSSRLT